MRSFEIRRRNVLLKHALRLHSDKKYILNPLILSRRFFGSAKEFVGIRLLVFDVGEILRYTSKASISLSSSPWSAGQIVGLED